jgi:hypothetical protein
VTKSRATPLEFFCFGLSIMMVIGWTSAAIFEWERNVDGLPTAVAIIVGLLVVGFWRRNKRLKNNDWQVSKNG